MSTPAIRAEVLGRLLVIPSLLEVLSETRSLLSFLAAALGEVPGIGAIALCAEGAVYPSAQGTPCDGCPSPSAFPCCPSAPSPCRLAAAPGAAARQAIPLATTQGCYGYLVLDASDRQQYALYEPHIYNLANLVATLLENRAAERDLRSANAGLAAVLDRLEQHVQERTQALSTEILQRQKLELDLRDSQQKLLQAQYIAKMGHFTWDILTGSVTWSDGLYRLLGYAPQEQRAIAQIEVALAEASDRQRIHQWLADGIAAGSQTLPPSEYRARRRDGSIVCLQFQGRLEYRGGKAVKLLGTCQDITERKQAEAHLKLAASVFAAAREGIFIADAQGTIVEVNAAFSEIAGYPREEVIGQPMQQFLASCRDETRYQELWCELVERGYWHGELWNQRKSGAIYAETLTLSAVRDEQGRPLHYVGLFSDITQQKEYQDRLERIAHYDPLTNLPNRLLLDDRLQQAMAQARRQGGLLAVVYLDLDGFKTINDTYGHATGDCLLVTLAARFEQALREGDTVARLGGDEFVALLLDLDSPQVSTAILNRLRLEASRPVRVGDRLLQVSASLGATFYPQREDIDAEQLLRQADQAMYQAKLAGKNRYQIFDAEGDRRLRHHHTDLGQLRRALEQDQVTLYYQPKVNMRSGAVVGATALVGWNHPQHGWLWLEDGPLLEGDPLAVELSYWTIATALRQLQSWQVAGLSLDISVQIAPDCLRQEDFVSRLRALLAAHTALAPGKLHLKLLESSILDNLAHVAPVMQACQALGLRFDLEAFGRGYASLAYLKQLPATQLELDASLTPNIADDPASLTVLDGVLRLAQAFQCEPVAVGVETIACGRILLQLGCELALGAAIAHPMPAAELAIWAPAWQPDPSWRQQQPLSASKLPLLFALVEHHAWIRKFDAYLRQPQHQPSLLPAAHHCRLSRWLAEEGCQHGGTQAAFSSLKGLHQQLHVLAGELLLLHGSGRTSEALARLNGLWNLNNVLVQQLQGLVQATDLQRL